MASRVPHRHHPSLTQAVVRARESVLPARVARTNPARTRDTDGGARAVLHPHQGAQITRLCRPNTRGRRARFLRHVLHLRQRRPAFASERPNPTNHRHVPHGHQRHHVRGVYLPQSHGGRGVHRLSGAGTPGSRR